MFPTLFHHCCNAPFHEMLYPIQINFYVILASSTRCILSGRKYFQHFPAIFGNSIMVVELRLRGPLSQFPATADCFFYVIMTRKVEAFATTNCLTPRACLSYIYQFSTTRFTRAILLLKLVGSSPLRYNFATSIQ